MECCPSKHQVLSGQTRRPVGGACCDGAPGGQGRADNALASFGLNFDALNRLNEHGLVIADYDSWASYTVYSSDVDRGVDLIHQGVPWDWQIQSEGVDGLVVEVHGVALTVSGRELACAVHPEPMPPYTRALQGFLLKEYGLRMVPVEGGALGRST